MSDHTKVFTGVKIVSDETNGLVELDTIRRYNQDRAIKVRNNFVGHLYRAESKRLNQIMEILNQKLLAVGENEIIVGLPTSGVIMAAGLSLVRGIPYNFGVEYEFENKDTAFYFHETDRGKDPQYLYGLKPGDNAIIIEDEVTSGNGVTELTKALREWGVNVIAIASVVEALNFDAREKIKTETGINLTSLVQIKLIE